MRTSGRLTLYWSGNDAPSGELCLGNGVLAGTNTSITDSVCIWPTRLQLIPRGTEALRLLVRYLSLRVGAPR
jgi:hypothetical protein